MNETAGSTKRASARNAKRAISTIVESLIGGERGSSHAQSIHPGRLCGKPARVEKLTTTYGRRVKVVIHKHERSRLGDNLASSPALWGVPLSALVPGQAVFLHIHAEVGVGKAYDQVPDAISPLHTTQVAR